MPYIQSESIQTPINNISMPLSDVREIARVANARVREISRLESEIKYQVTMKNVQRLIWLANN